MLEVSHPALSPYLPEAHQAVVAAAIREQNPDVVVFENTTAGLDLAAASAAATDRAVRRLLRRAVDRRRPRRSPSAASTPASCWPARETSLPAVFTVNVDRAARRSPCRPAAESEPSWRPPHELDNLKTTFVEAVIAVRRGRRPDQGRSDRLRRPRNRRGRQHPDRRGARGGAGCRARRLASGDRLRLAAEGPPDRQVRARM